MLEITIKESTEKYYFSADINKNIELIGGSVAGNGSIDWSNDGISLETITNSILGEQAHEVLAVIVDDTAYPLDYILTKNATLSFIFANSELGKKYLHYYALFCTLKSMHLLYPAAICTQQSYDSSGFSCTFSREGFDQAAWQALLSQISHEISANPPVQKRLPYYKAFPLLRQSGYADLVRELQANECYDGLRLVISDDFACYHEDLAVGEPKLFEKIAFSYLCQNDTLTIYGKIS